MRRGLNERGVREISHLRTLSDHISATLQDISHVSAWPWPCNSGTWPRTWSRAIDVCINRIYNINLRNSSTRWNMIFP